MTSAAWVLGGCGALLLAVSPAFSLPSGQAQSPETEQLLRRILILEERVNFLQRQVDMLQHSAVVESLDESESLDALPPAECADPFIVDEAGIRRVRPACLAAATSSCVPPFSVTAEGIKRMDRACVTEESENDCDTPYEVDGRGVKRFRTECLNSQ